MIGQDRTVSLWYYAAEHNSFFLFSHHRTALNGLALTGLDIHGRGINGHRRTDQHRHKQYQQIQFIIMYKDLRAMYLLASVPRYLLDSYFDSVSY